MVAQQYYGDNINTHLTLITGACSSVCKGKRGRGANSLHTVRNTPFCPRKKQETEQRLVSTARIYGTAVGTQVCGATLFTSSRNSACMFEAAHVYWQKYWSSRHYKLGRKNCCLPKAHTSPSPFASSSQSIFKPVPHETPPAKKYLSCWHVSPPPVLSP